MCQDAAALRRARGFGAALQGPQGEADRVDERAGVASGIRAAAPVPVERFQQGPGPGGAEELIDVGERLDQPGGLAAVHCACPGAAAVPNPAQAEVPGWAEYASSATAAGPAAGAAGLVAGDGQQVTVAEPARQRGGAQRGINSGRPGERGELDRLGHLRADPGGARGGGLGQPGPGAVADRQERFLPARGRLDPRRPRRPVRLLRMIRVVGQVDPRVPRS